MATSGTVAQTTITTDKLLEHTFRRCGIPPSLQNPEMVMAAKESLFMLVTFLASRGLNLWCVEKNYIPLIQGKAKYSLPPGTISVLNVLSSTPQYLPGTGSSTATSLTTQLESEGSVTRLKLTLNSLPTTSVLLESSDDGISWTTIQTLTLSDLAVGDNWFDIDPASVTTYLRASVSSGTLSGSLSAASGVRDLNVNPISRDSYTLQPNKESQGSNPTDYFFEKTLSPTITLWPVSNTSQNFLTVWVHRQVEDVGSLSQNLAVPPRWLESIIRHLAVSVALELPGIPEARIALLKGLADEAQLTTELDETDMAPIMISPNITAYTR